jgi:hypothetical protein
MNRIKWRITLFLDMIRDLPDLWKTKAEFEALCMGTVDRMSCYKEILKGKSL